MICHICSKLLSRKLVTVIVVIMLFLPILVLSLQPPYQIEATTDPTTDSVYSDLIDNDAAQVVSDPTEIKTTLANANVDVNVDPMNQLETTTLKENLETRSTERVSEEARTDANKLSTTDTADLERTTNSLEKDNKSSSSSTPAVLPSALTSSSPDTTSTSKTSQSVTSTTTQLTILSTSTLRISENTTATQIPTTTPETTSTSTPQGYSTASNSSTQTSKISPASPTSYTSSQTSQPTSTTTSPPTLNATPQASSSYTTPQNVHITLQSAFTPYISEVDSILPTSMSSSDTAYLKYSTQPNSDVSSAVSPFDTSYQELSTQWLANAPSVYASTVTFSSTTSGGSADVFSSVTSDSLISTPSIQEYTSSSHGPSLLDEKSLISSASVSLLISSSTSLFMTSSIMTSSPSTTKRTTTLSGSRVLCPCYICSTATKTVKLKTLVKELVDRLKVDQSALSTTRRMRESQNDERPSAKAVGYVGVVFMVVTLLVVVLFDISRFCCLSNSDKRRLRQLNR